MREKRIRVKKYFWWIGIVCLLLFGLQFFQSNAVLVEQYFSRTWYPIFSFLPKIVFAWIPFSVGDLFYALLILTALWLIVDFGKLIWKRQWKLLNIRLLKCIAVGLTVYLYFYVSWGTNYYRVPLSRQLALQTDTITLSQHLKVLDSFISNANRIRSTFQIDALDRNIMAEDLTLLMKNDSIFSGILSKTNIKVKSPLSSPLISSLTVTGYFNPFTQEVHVNEQVPIIGYPFTVVHELSHQMGIGFEDECNFIAFIKLKNHENPFYQYSAYFEAINYLMRPLYFTDLKIYKDYQKKLSSLIVKDIEQERLFWQQHKSWMNTVSDYFYVRYLKHNNQPEGMARYSLMSRLVIANELKNEHE